MTRQIAKNQRKSTEIEFGDQLPATFEKPGKPPTSVMSLSFWLLFFGVGLMGSLGVWASVSHIEGAVVASGTFEVEGDLQVVEHLEGGIIRNILVREGDEVEAGQIIAELDSSRIDAQVNIWRSQFVAALARDARLRAEFNGADVLEPAPELVEIIAANKAYQEILDTQTELFLSNRLTDFGQVAILNERISQLNEQLAGINDRREKLHDQLEIVVDEVKDLETLFDKGLTLKSRVSERREDAIILYARVGQADSERQSVLQEISEVEERKLQIGRERRYTIANERQAATEQVFDIRQRLVASEAILERLKIKAPIAGRLVGFRQNSIGAVIDPGQSLLEIVPRDAGFIVKARVGTGDIDEVTLFGPARIRLSSYSFRKTPPVNATVTYVAADATYDDANNQNFYEVHLAIAQDEMENLPNVRALPGMPVQVMITTGKQTIMTYLLDPVLGGFETAMVEGE